MCSRTHSCVRVRASEREIGRIAATDTPAVYFIDHPDDRPLFQVSPPLLGSPPRESFLAPTVNRCREERIRSARRDFADFALGDSSLLKKISRSAICHFFFFFFLSFYPRNFVTLF